ncbi:MAG TPA: hypothetical protein VJV03_06205 [Pyrinomonadaceae bacterium]|nr:hypothetical protein [Pyrinomonadaceae bacterium]
MCTYANGPYWRSAIEPLLYPSGCSFYRPFSYRREYLSDSLSAAFATANERKRFLSDEDRCQGIFGLSFNSTEGKAFYESFIPLRIVTLTDIQGTDEYHLFFRLGPYVKLEETKKLRRLSLSGLVDFDKPTTRLMIDISATGPLFKEATTLLKGNAPHSELPTGFWDSLIKDESVSTKAKQNFDGATILRLLEVRERGESRQLEPTLLKRKLDLREIRENRTSTRLVYGFDLQAETVYDIQLAYSRLLPRGKESEHQVGAYKFASPAEHYEVSKLQIPITGNYRYEGIWIRPKKGQPAPTTLDWVGTSVLKKGDNQEQADPNSQKIIGLQIPILNHYTFWTTERIIYALLVVVFSISAAAAFWKALSLGSIRVTPGEPPSPLITIATALGAFFAAIAGSSLQSLVKAFFEDSKSG